MSMAALLARLNPANCNMDRISGGSAPEITDHDIAAALGLCKMPDPARYLVRAKWAKQDDAIRPLHIYLYQAVMAEDGDSWIKLRSHRPGLVLDLTRLATHEYCRADICSSCNGTKEAVIGGRVVACHTCRGSGVTGRQDSDRRRASELGLAWATYQRIWSVLFGRCYEVMADWERLALGAARRRIFGE